MADKKISALTGATTSLAGTEVLPIVQGGATVKVSVADLTAGRALSATQMTLTAGNLIVANNQGIDFSATPNPAGMTSELLDDYEEGVWTPVVNFGGADGGSSYVLQSGYYTKVGDQVTVWCYAMINVPSAATGGMTISGLPFASTSGTNFVAVCSAALDNAASNIDQPIGRIFPGQSEITMMSGTGTNNWNQLTDSGVKANSLRVYSTISYKV